MLNVPVMRSCRSAGEQSPSFQLRTFTELEMIREFRSKDLTIASRPPRVTGDSDSLEIGTFPAVISESAWSARL
jgi:hypothetical protein